MPQKEPFILFEVAGTTYGVRSAQVQQVEMIEQVTRVPNAPPFVDGVVYVRGQVVPVINLRSRFGFERLEYDLRARLVVINHQGRTIGLAVDSAREFTAFEVESILPPPDALAGDAIRFLEGALALDNERLVFILLPEKLLSVEEEASLPE